MSHVSPLCPMPAHPQSAVLSISSSQFPVAQQELQSSFPVHPVQGNKTPNSWRKRLEGQAGMPWPFPGMDKGPGVCLSTAVMGLPSHVAMDGTQSHVSVPLGRQSLREGKGCNEEIGVNLINSWVSCIKNSDERSAHKDICCDLHAIPQATVR